MTILQLLTYPDPRLRVKAQPVTTFDKELRKLVDDMYESMYDHHGIGLAATQLGIHQQIFVMDVSENRSQRYCAINPQIMSKEGTQQEVEGCLSVGGAYDKVVRAAKVHMKALDIDGKEFELHAEELMAACIQHETDHLNGVLFIDHLSRLKQERIKKKIAKLQRR